ncbi:Chalcone_isomerase domain-containing protein (plasmid) [Rhodovastum atsumiense]|nr:chalcone isomerase family protein [Rhodovastum atsumiense]CAH2605629.1 Chalcone_isomerase domain-containing protein [Rhodovastum atsumiense]
MRRALLSVVAGFALLSSARAAELEGVTLPDEQWIGRTELRLNGIALRSYSVLQIPIYVGGLYLVHPDSDPERILRSTDMKLLDIRFLRDVDQERARAAWREGFDRNCDSPCDLSSAEVARFLAAVPAVRKGDRFTILFTPSGAEISVNQRPLGRIANRRFATVMLATFIGPHPPTSRVKRELLGSRTQANG